MTDSPTEAADEILMATCWTTAGPARPDLADQRSPLPLRERIEATARAGFRGMGVLGVDLAEAERRYGLAGIGAILADNGIIALELEGIPDWWSRGPERAASDEIRELLLRAAETLGARHIKVTPDGENRPWDRGLWAAELATLARQCADVGVRLGLEFFPWSNVPGLREALDLLDEAGEPAAGVVVDAWHVDRGAIPLAELAALPVERIVGVELDDADREVVGTLFEDTVYRRRYCGQGAIDLAGIVAALRRAGWRGPWGVEILSDEHRALDLEEACRRAHDSGRATLAATGLLPPMRAGRDR